MNPPHQGRIRKLWKLLSISTVHPLQPNHFNRMTCLLIRLAYLQYPLLIRLLPAKASQISCPTYLRLINTHYLQSAMVSVPLVERIERIKENIVRRHSVERRFINKRRQPTNADRIESTHCKYTLAYILYDRDFATTVYYLVNDVLLFGLGQDLIRSKSN